MKRVPMITWNPWNPVEKKKHDPYTPSAIVKSASTYSSPCSAVNSAASRIVSAIPIIAARRLPSITAWWAYVTVAPLERSRTVLRRGTVIGLRAVTPTGGHCDPSSTVGASEEWKYLQKIDRKKKISVTMNSVTPIVRPFCTISVWSPRYVPSAVMSRNHRMNANSVDRNPSVSRVDPCAIPFMYRTPPTVIDSTALAVRRGQGLASTRWKGKDWNWYRGCDTAFVIIYVYNNY
uniref:Uncharacterized protein n=1 Tax=Hannaella oryzae TaxID=4979 RepID=A0A385JEZ7_9TREE|nr:hypothetical protein [Hannaella oryzae]AXY96248.1 hypothetical protein [Hannaella oryzae]